MSESLAIDHEGNALVAFHRAAEGGSVDDAPLTASLVAWWHNERLLLVFDRQRQQWELPGGMIDPGETPRQAAVRELREETGYELEQLALAGHARFALGPERRSEYAAVFGACAVPHGRDFTPNEEIIAVCWWDGVQPLSGRVQILDVLLGQLSRSSSTCPTGDGGR
ncbi:8-oxo-dGTP diphosphatase [Micromonospora pisi]|uniref:8-oxo-dGTP diphosphatase n=1 Tax=Micromonospora pisi TaxID=589240 RepID=A0A495JS44_9ACTN|nr:NUDIX hydrolase [Micromonospora pisi]RKR91806.1 8-oxo-dGTP diphosphatase [Micromonospora pisi]